LKYKVPVRKFSYEIDMRNSISQLSDNMNYKNSQYATEVDNKFLFRVKNVMVEPNNQTKLSLTSQKNPDNKGNEIENKLSVRITPPEIKRVGEFMIKTDFEWRKRGGEGRSDIRRRYLLNLTYIRKFFDNYRLTVLTSQDRETYGGSTPIAGANPNQTSAAKTPKSVSTYRIDLQAKPAAKMVLNGNFMITSQKSSKINKIGFSIIADLPLINMPVKSFITRQTRILAGLPKQTQLTSETTLSYRFRQITLILTYNYNHENLLNENYSFSEIYGKITRGFSIL